MVDKKGKKVSKIHSSSRKMASVTGTASILRCPESLLNRFRTLNQAEYIILFTPVVPHPAATELSLDMDPFEPLGRSLSRRHSRIRHVPYIPSRGLTATHVDFLRSAGAVIVVICTPGDPATAHAYGFSDQTGFAKDLTQQISQDTALTAAPLVLLLITEGTLSHQEGVKEFPAVITCTNYTPAALDDVARVLFGA